LIAAKKYYSQKFMELQESINKTENKTIKDSLRTILRSMSESDETYTPEAIELNKKGEELSLAFSKWKKEYIRQNSSIVSYSLLVENMNYAVGNKTEDIPEYVDLFKSVYSKKYPSHPYTKKMNNLILSYSAVKIGGSYIDFTAPDFSGNTVTLSEQIKGKVALIDLWASWCGPCRGSAMSMIPVYEAYKNKGFTIVGIARERELSAGINAAKKDGYLWLNLIEIQDAGKIWEKYGLGNSGGSSFLVNKEGKIISIHPTAEEVKAKLDELLK
jgi:thiol-disulfide isomerase/thioredoxin